MARSLDHKVPSEVDLNCMKEFFKYHDGKLVWGKKKCRSAKIGKEVGTINQGYRRVSVNYKLYMVHRVIWYITFNEWPDSQIDHIDGNSLNNNLDNLRKVDRSGNSQNLKVHREGRPIGVHKHKGRWIARAPRSYLDHQAPENLNIGSFDTCEEARDAVVAFCKQGSEE